MLAAVVTVQQIQAIQLFCILPVHHGLLSCDNMYCLVFGMAPLPVMMFQETCHHLQLLLGVL